MITAEQWWSLHKDHILQRPVFIDQHPSILRFPGNIRIPGSGTWGKARCPKCETDEMVTMRPAESYNDFDNYKDRI